MKMIKKIVLIVIVFILLFSINVKVFALSEIIDDGQLFLQQADSNFANIDQGAIKSLSGYLYNILLSLGVVIAVIVATVLGVQFMLSEAEGQAKVKEMLKPFVIGCVIIFGGFGIWKLAVTIGGKIDNTDSVGYYYTEKDSGEIHCAACGKKLTTDEIAKGVCINCAGTGEDRKLVGEKPTIQKEESSDSSSSGSSGLGSKTPGSGGSSSSGLGSKTPSSGGSSSGSLGSGGSSSGSLGSGESSSGSLGSGGLSSGSLGSGGSSSGSGLIASGEAGAHYWGEKLTTTAGTIYYSHTLPKDYNKKDKKMYPLIIAVPGWGEMLVNGNIQGYSQPWNAIQNWQGYTNWSDAIVVCAQIERSLYTSSTASTQIMELITHMKLTYRGKINTNKVYGIGFSAGATVMSMTVNNNPGVFAAYAHGGNNWVNVPNTTSESSKQILDSLAKNNVSVCFYGAANDTNCQWYTMNQIKNYLQSKGCNVIVKQNGYDHGSGQSCLLDSSFRQWLLSQ